MSEQFGVNKVIDNQRIQQSTDNVLSNIEPRHPVSTIPTPLKASATPTPMMETSNKKEKLDLKYINSNTKPISPDFVPRIKSPTRDNANKTAQYWPHSRLRAKLITPNTAKNLAALIGETTPPPKSVSLKLLDNPCSGISANKNATA